MTGGEKMAEKDKKYYWLKLKKDFFKRHDIQIIESMENGKDYILFYLKLLCESVDHEGNLRFSEEIPYNDKMLATITNTNIDIVRSAVKLFTSLNMMTLLDDATLYMNKIEDMIGSETYWAQKKREQKAKTINNKYEYIRVLSHEQIALPNGETRFIDEKRYGGNGKAVWERAQCKCEICGTTNNLCIHHDNGYSNELEDLILVCRSCHRKIETGEIGKFPTLSNKIPTCPSKSIDKDIELDKDKKNNETKVSNEFIQSIIDSWNSLSLSKLTKIAKGSARYKSINARIKDYGEEAFINAIRSISQSDFLRGINDRGWVITFDWFIKPNNFVKVLDGNYINRKREDANGSNGQHYREREDDIERALRKQGKSLADLEEDTDIDF